MQSTRSRHHDGDAVSDLHLDRGFCLPLLPPAAAAADWFRGRVQLRRAFFSSPVRRPCFSGGSMYNRSHRF
jgi:hypothetical protein